MEERNEKIKGYAAVLATALLWSTGGIFIKTIPWAALSINSARCLVALLFKFAVKRDVRIGFSPHAIVGGLAMSATTTLFVFANKLTTSANAIMLQYSFPMFLIIYVWIHSKIKPKPRDVLTSGVIIAGVFLCCLDNFTSGGALGNILAIISGLSFALYFFINSMDKAKPHDANCIGFLIGFLLGLPSLLSERDFSFTPIFFSVLLGAFQVGLAYVLFEYGIKRISAVNASFISAIEPVLSPVWVALFYKELIGRYAVAGSLLVVGATVYYSIQTAKTKDAP